MPNENENKQSNGAAIVKITEEKIALRLKAMGKNADGSTKVCDKHEKRLTRSNIKGDEPKWILSLGDDAVTLVLRVSCGHSKDPCYGRHAADIAVKNEAGDWMETTLDYNTSKVAPEAVLAIAEPAPIKAAS